MEDHDAVVVGGGVAGLACAALLARRGWHVTLLERGQLGGRARTTMVADAALNLGPHAWFTRGAATPVLAELGVRLRGGSPDDAALQLVVDGRLVRYGMGGGPRADAQGLSALDRLAHRDVPAPDTTISQWLETGIPDAAARAVAGAVARLSTYADAAHVQAADVFAAQLRAQPVRYLDGGWVQLVEGLRTAAESAGANIVTGAAVRRVVHDGARVTGVVTGSGPHRPARTVVLAVGGPGHAATLLYGEPRTRLDQAAERAAPAAIACLDVALERPVPGARFVLGVDEPLYLSVHSEWAALSGAGAVLHAAHYLTPGQRGDPAIRARLERLVDQALPGWRDHVAHARFLPAITVTHDLALAATGGLHGRADAEATGLDGLYVAGDWVGSAGYLAHAALASAADVAARVGPQVAAST